jgi:hypothetical protein
MLTHRGADDAKVLVKPSFIFLMSAGRVDGGFSFEQEI